METNNIDHERFIRAQKRVRAISGFYRHLAAYILINLFLIGLKFVNLDKNEEFFRFNTFSTAVYWGIGLAFHAVGVFGGHFFLGKNWEERKIAEIMERDKRQKWE